MKEINAVILKNLTEIQKLSSFTSWIADEKLSDDDIVIVNNSFVHREQSYTNKNENYIAYAISKTQKIGTLYSYSESRVIKNFKLYTKEKVKDAIVPIDDVIKKEMKNIGELVFILLGSVNENITLTKGTGSSFLSSVQYNPTFKENKVEGDTLYLNDTTDEEEIWGKINSAFAREVNFGEGAEKLRKEVGKLLDEIEDESYSKLILKKDLEKDAPTIIQSMLSILLEQQKEYSTSVKEFVTSKYADAKAFNNILRIAYNFSTDATTLLKLIISICDLKPVVLWGTI